MINLFWSHVLSLYLPTWWNTNVKHFQCDHHPPDIVSFAFPVRTKQPLPAVFEVSPRRTEISREQDLQDQRVPPCWYHKIQDEVPLTRINQYPIMRVHFWSCGQCTVLLPKRFPIRLAVWLYLCVIFRVDPELGWFWESNFLVFDHSAVGFNLIFNAWPINDQFAIAGSVFIASFAYNTFFLEQAILISTRKWCMLQISS